MTVNNGSVKLFNNSKSSAEITKIEFEDPLYADAAKFSLGSINYPVKLDIDSTLDIPVIFEPQKEQSYSTNMLIYLLGLTTPIKANIKGEGFLPKIDLTWTCSQGTKVGEQSTGTLDIKSIDPQTDLLIYSADILNNNGEYEWITPKPTNIIIPGGQSKQYLITFKPNSVGIRSNTINVISDASAGPDINPKVAKSLAIECEALGSDYTETIDFETILACSELSLPFTVKNTSPSTELNISSYSFENPTADKDYFSVELSTPLKIQPNESKSFNIVFKPVDVKGYNAKVVFVNDQDLDIHCNLIGNAVQINYYTDNTLFNEYPGKKIDFSVFAKLPKLSSKLPASYQTDFNLDILFNSKMLKYVDASFSSPLTQFIWSNPDLTQLGQINIKGKGKLTTPFDGKIYIFKFDTFLGDTSNTDIIFRPISDGCKSSEQIVSKYNTTGICFLSGRYITGSGTEYFIKNPEPNPASNSTKINFSAAFNSPATLDIYDAYGKHIVNILNQDLKAGNYEVEINLKDFTSGLYFVRYNCGTYTGTVEILVTK